MGYKLKGVARNSGSVVVTRVNTQGADPHEPKMVHVDAVEAEPVAGDWSVEAETICVTVGTP
jgi:hypothetical protein